MEAEANGLSVWRIADSAYTNEINTPSHLTSSFAEGLRR
jgi:hypothetical protein